MTSEERIEELTAQIKQRDDALDVVRYWVEMSAGMGGHFVIGKAREEIRAALKTVPVRV